MFFCLVRVTVLYVVTKVVTDGTKRRTRTKQEQQQEHVDRHLPLRRTGHPHGPPGYDGQDSVLPLFRETRYEDLHDLQVPGGCRR